MNPTEILSHYTNYSCGSNHFNINHPACPAGEDTKRRLYITRPDERPWVVLAYCHNCGDSGAATISAKAVNFIESTKVPVLKEPDKEIDTTLHDLGVRWDFFPDEVKSYLLNHGITEGDVTKFGIRWNYDRYALVYPMLVMDMSNYTKDLNENRLVSFYQMRPMYNTYVGPKYITYKLKEDFNKPLRNINSLPADTLVIVEDFLSAIRVFNSDKACLVSGHVQRSNVEFDPYCLWGSHLSISDLVKLAKEYKNVVVWLDNDNDIIRDKAEMITETFKAMGIPAMRNKDDHDPKNYSELHVMHTIETYVRRMTNHES